MSDASVVWERTHRVAPRLVLAPLQRGGGDPTQRRLPDGTVWRTALTPAGPATLRLTPTDGAVVADAWGAGADWMIGRVPHLLGEYDDPSGFVPQHPAVEAAYRKFGHLPLTSTGLIFELTAVSILEQKVTGQEARSSWRTLLLRFGSPAPGPAPDGMRVMPSPGEWRRLPSWEWHRANVTPQRMRTLIAAASVAGRLDESIGLPREDRFRRLRAVPGIGAWTAAEVALRAWGDPDVVSVGDFHLAALVGWTLLGRPIDDDEMLEVLSVYEGHRSRAVRLIELVGNKPKFGPRFKGRDIRAI